LIISYYIRVLIVITRKSCYY